MGAPELEDNGMEAQLKAQRVHNIQLKAQRALITEKFDVGYPEYQHILEQYTPSMIFAGKRGAGAALDTGDVTSRTLTSYN